MVPLHLLISKLQAKLIINKLNERQKELHLMENLAGLFEKNITFARMLMPTTEPAGWNKKIKARLRQLTDKAKELVQSLNDNFGSYNEQIHTGAKEQTHASYLDLSKL
jgi:phage-related tail protein